MHRRSKISVLQASMKAWTNNRAICAFIWRVAGAGSARLRMKANDAILGCQTASLSLHVVLGSAAGAAPLSGWLSRWLNHCASVALPASCSPSSSPPFRPSRRWQDKVRIHGVSAVSHSWSSEQTRHSAGASSRLGHMPGLIRVGRQK
jgi:hypothetical protein